MKANETIHELTRAQIARQIGELNDRRRQLVERRADLYKRQCRSGAEPTIGPEEKAVRAHAKKLLNGSAPEFLNTSTPEFDFASEDKRLEVEQRAIDLTIKILSEKDVAALAADAVQWAEDNSAQWRHISREIILAYARIDALEQAALSIIERCPDISAVNLPLIHIIGQKEAVFDTWIPEAVTASRLIEAALAVGFVTKRDVADAKKIDKVRADG
jgi:hypothetical protein